MDLIQHYDAMRRAAFDQLQQQGPSVDSLIDSAQDTRRGITLLARPAEGITAKIAAVLADFHQSEPDQYYYPVSDIHLTVLSIISCYPGFALNDINVEAYQDTASAIARQTAPFAIRFSGLTASPSGVMVQGMPLGEGLKHLREETRRFFRKSGLQQSIDLRYTLQTAHATVIRFKSGLLNTAAFIKKVEQYEGLDFGVFTVDAVELVYNDWYQRAANTVLLGKYSLSQA
jgi:2'-5' RNA ligase